MNTPLAVAEDEAAPTDLSAILRCLPLHFQAATNNIEDTITHHRD